MTIEMDDLQREGGRGPTSDDLRRGLRLSERIGLGPVVDHDDAEARDRADFWEDHEHFASKMDAFRVRLRAEGIGDEVLLETLGEPLHRLAERAQTLPAWIREVEAALADETTVGAIAEDGNGPTTAFRRAAYPFVVRAQRRIRQGVESLRAPAQLRSSLIDALTPPMWDRFDGVLTRTMVQELHRDRIGHDDAPPSADGFRAFVDSFVSRERLEAFYADYPVLARQVSSIAQHWAESAIEFATRLVDDRGELSARLRVDLDGARVASVDFGQGDTHRHGRTVAIVQLVGGTRFVYKPRPLSVDVHWNDLVTACNEAGLRNRLRTTWTISREHHGWCEFIEAAPCDGEGSAARFYNRLGSLLAALHVLAATDFHFENLIASGEYPVPIDLEALLHPSVADTGVEELTTGDLALRDSVLGIGLLPRPILFFEEGRAIGVDLSGIGSPEGQLTPSELPVWDDVGTDRMRLRRRRVPMGAASNQPQVGGRPVDPTEHIDDIVDGFRETYALLLANRDAFEERGLFEAFRSDQVRVVVRPTRLYGRILQEGSHPDLLIDALERDRYLAVLWPTDDQRPIWAAIADAEARQLEDGDVPMFWCRADERDLQWGGGTVPAAVGETGWSRLRDRLDRLGDDDLERQSWFVRASMTALRLGLEPGFWPSKTTDRSHRGTRLDALRTARGIGDLLLHRGLVVGEDVAWVGLNLLQERLWHLGPVPRDTYSGEAGIALALAQLGHVSGDRTYTDVARRVADRLTVYVTSLEDMDDDVLLRLGIGAFGDVGGPVSVLRALGRLWDDPGLVAAAGSGAALIARVCGEDDALDVVAGAAGALLMTVGAADVPAGTAAALATRLRDAAEVVSDGIAWRASINPERPLTGFAHGTSGVIAALARYRRVSGDQSADRIIDGALDFERASWDRAQNRWPDLRSPDDTEPMSAWCHGAPGIALSRIELLRSGCSSGDAAVAEDLEATARATEENGFVGRRFPGRSNHSLCHGDLGNLEILRAAAATTGDSGMARRADEATAAIVREIDERGPICGVPSGVETPGLMTGLSGIVHGLLRWVDPEAIPSVLAVEATS